MLALAFLDEGRIGGDQFVRSLGDDRRFHMADLHASRTDFVLHHFLRQTAGFGHHIRRNLVAVGVLGTTTGLGDLASLEVGKILLGDLESGSLRFGELFSLKVLGEDFGHTSIQKGFEALLEHELVGFVGKRLQIDFQTLTSFRDFDIHGAHCSSIFGVWTPS